MNRVKLYICSTWCSVSWSPYEPSTTSCLSLSCCSSCSPPSAYSSSRLVAFSALLKMSLTSSKYVLYKSFIHQKLVAHKKTLKKQTYINLINVLEDRRRHHWRILLTHTHVTRRLNRHSDIHCRPITDNLYSP